MKNILLLLLPLLLQTACTSLPTKEGEISYSDLHNSIAQIHIVHPDTTVIENRDLLYSNLIREIRDGWPDLNIEQSTNTDSISYCLEIEVISYRVEYDTHKTSETIDKKTTHYDVYETNTILDFKYKLIDRETKKTVWSKFQKAINTDTNKEVDSCYSSNIFKQLTCDILIEPVVDGLADIIFPFFGPSNDKYPTAISYENIFSTAGKNIAKSLPTPKCSSDGYSTCISHFFRNTLGF